MMSLHYHLTYLLAFAFQYYTFKGILVNTLNNLLYALTSSWRYMTIERYIAAIWAQPNFTFCLSAHKIRDYRYVGMLNALRMKAGAFALICVLKLRCTDSI